MAIEKADLKALAIDFFKSVHGGVEDEATVGAHFVDPARAQLVAPDGSHFTITSHRELHRRFLDEKHVLGDFELVQISSAPERARAKGWVYFEARYKDAPERGLLKSIVGEEYILERGEDGKVRFIQYNSTFFATLPDSAEFNIG